MSEKMDKEYQGPGHVQFSISEHDEDGQNDPDQSEEEHTDKEHGVEEQDSDAHQANSNGLVTTGNGLRTVLSKSDFKIERPAFSQVRNNWNMLPLMF